MPDRNRHPLATLMQAQYACFGIGTVGVAIMDPMGPAGTFIRTTGWPGYLMLIGLSICSLLSMADVIFNHHQVRRVWWLGACRHWFGIGQAFSWTAMIFVGLMRFQAIGLMVIFSIAIFFLAAFLLYEARTRRAACARDPSTC